MAINFNKKMLSLSLFVVTTAIVAIVAMDDLFDVVGKNVYRIEVIFNENAKVGSKDLIAYRYHSEYSDIPHGFKGKILIGDERKPKYIFFSSNADIPLEIIANNRDIAKNTASDGSSIYSFGLNGKEPFLFLIPRNITFEIRNTADQLDNEVLERPLIIQSENKYYSNLYMFAFGVSLFLVALTIILLTVFKKTVLPMPPFNDVLYLFISRSEK